MRNRIKLAFLVFFLIVIIFQIIYTFVRKPECSSMHVDEMISFSVSDEEMARKIANVVMEIEDEKDYDIISSFDKENDEWVITYMLKNLQKDDEVSTQEVVRIRKDTGTITLHR